jgi:effector-binding domain-containing protein
VEEREANSNLATEEVQEKYLEPMLIAGIRVCGPYSDSGKAFGRLGRKLGRSISGPAFLLHYDCEFKENDANFEACMPIRSAKDIDGIAVREQPGGNAICVLHRGPYVEMGRTYARLLKYIKQMKYEIVMPTREIYVKCPGLIFKGNPRNYLTEIQIPINTKGKPK